MTDYNGHTTSYMYTARGELASLTAPGSKVWSFAYNALGQRTQYTHPNGTRTEYGYDTQNRRTSIQHKDASTEAVLLGLTYTLNDGGNITRIDHNDASYWTYGYDNRDRLTGAMRYNTTGNLLHWYGYTYDNADNMTQRWRFQASNSQTDVWAYTYNVGNEQLSMTLNGGTPETRTYDNWGRLATRTQGSYSASYAYRYGGRLYQATSNFPNESNVTLDYGGDGKLRTRTTASETRTYRYDRGWNAVNEEVSGATAVSNVFEPGAQVGAILAQTFGTLASGTPVYAYHDHLATVRQWRFLNKNLARANEYDPYGNFYSYSGYFNMPRIYALHEFDTGLQQYRAPYRHYRPIAARWTTPDPMGMVDGPNMYGYVGGNVILMVDPTGGFALPGLFRGIIYGGIIGGFGGLITGGLSGVSCGVIGGLTTATIASIGIGTGFGLVLTGVLGGAIGGFVECICKHNWDTSKAHCCTALVIGGGIGGGLGGVPGWAADAEDAVGAIIGAITGYSFSEILPSFSPENEDDCC